MVYTNHYPSKETFEQLFYLILSSHPSSLTLDPVFFPRQFTSRNDIEIAAFISSLIAFGQVKTMNQKLDHFFSILGPSPSYFLRNFSKNTNLIKDTLFAWKYRFVSGKIMLNLLKALSTLYATYGSIEDLYLEEYLHSGDMWKANEQLINKIRGFIPASILENDKKTLNFLLPISKNTPMKRLNLFLRWMVRKDDFDLGLWHKIPREKLLVPLDTHVFRLASQLFITKRKTPDRRACLEITTFLKSIVPDDPLKFDMVFSHFGISRFCLHRFDAEKCTICPFQDVCVHATFS